MKSHGEIQDTLYDFVMNDLGAEEMEAVSLHLRTCGECRTAVEEIEQLVAAVPRPHGRPSDRVDEPHWAELAARVERSLPPARSVAGRHAMDAPHAPRPRYPKHALSSGERLRMFLPWPRPAFALSLAALAVALTAVLALWPREHEEPVAHTAEAGVDEAGQDFRTGSLSQLQGSGADIAAHLRRSKNLLVGLANKPIEPEATADLSVEREASLRLLADNRRYRSEVLDQQSSEVLADLEKIMLEVANSRDQAAAADLDLIRQGIRQQNLLFKVRMAERLSSRGLIVRASGQ